MSISDKLIETKLNSLNLNDSENKNDDLRMETESIASEEENSIRRSLRKRIRPADPIEKRRVIVKPAKRKSENKDFDAVDINIYTCKNLERNPLNLETIYEEPRVNSNEEVSYIGGKKQKRFILFEPNNKGKIKKRQAKIKKYFGRNLLKQKRASMDALIEKLSRIE